MPIRFRCSYCNRLLGIATRKAGTETTCPHCGYTITVPVPQEDDGRTERISADVGAALGEGATEVIPPPVTAPPDKPRFDPPKPPKPRAAVAPSKPPPVPHDPNDPPLFERDMDEILGKTAAPAEPEREARPKVSGMDALSLDEPVRQIVLSAQKATFLMIAVVVLLLLAFVAGYMVAPKG